MMMSSPEPMSLGSPTQSPTSNNVNQYLPQFLLGDLPTNQNSQLNSRNQYGNSNLFGNHNHNLNHLNHHHQNMQGSLGRSYSMNAYDVKINNSNLIEKSESNYGSHYHNQNSHHFNNNQNYSPHHERTIGSTSILGGSVGSNLVNQSSNVPGAPPVNRLADMLSKPTFGAASSNSLLLQNTPNESRTTRVTDYYNSDKNQDLSFTPSNNGINPHRLSPPSPTQVDPFYTYGEQIKVDEKLDDTWITVFGFPQSATSYVLQEFSVYGQILKHTSTQGNWLHIQYQTKLQAQKALSKNGKVLANNIMVGVMKCIDKNVMSGSNYNNNNSNLSNADVSQGPNGSLIADTSVSSNKLGNLGKAFPGVSGAKLDRTQSLRSGVRPLGQFNRNLDSSSATTDSMPNSRLPKKNTNVISKAMEYMFGW